MLISVMLITLKVLLKSVQLLMKRFANRHTGASRSTIEYCLSCCFMYRSLNGRTGDRPWGQRSPLHMLLFGVTDKSDISAFVEKTQFVFVLNNKQVSLF